MARTEQESSNQLDYLKLRDKLSAFDTYLLTALDIALKQHFPEFRSELIALQSKETAYHAYSRLTIFSEFGLLLSAYLSGKYYKVQLDELNTYISDSQLQQLFAIWQSFKPIIIPMYRRLEHSTNGHAIALAQRENSVHNLTEYFLSHPDILAALHTFTQIISEHAPEAYHALIEAQRQEEFFENTNRIYPITQVGIVLCCLLVQHPLNSISDFTRNIDARVLNQLVILLQKHRYEIEFQAVASDAEGIPTQPFVNTVEATLQFIDSTYEDHEFVRDLAEDFLLTHEEYLDYLTERAVQLFIFMVLHYPDISVRDIQDYLEVDFKFVTDIQDWIESVTLVEATIAQGVEEFLTAEFNRAEMK